MALVCRQKKNNTVVENEKGLHKKIKPNQGEKWDLQSF